MCMDITSLDISSRRGPRRVIGRVPALRHFFIEPHLVFGNEIFEDIRTFTSVLVIPDNIRAAPHPDVHRGVRRRARGAGGAGCAAVAVQRAAGPPGGQAAHLIQRAHQAQLLHYRYVHTRMAEKF